MAFSPLLEAPAASVVVAACPDLTWDPLPPPDQVDVNGTLLWHPAPEVVVKARRIYGDRWEVLTTSGTTTQARVVPCADVALLVGAARP